MEIEETTAAVSPDTFRVMKPEAIEFRVDSDLHVRERVPFTTEEAWKRERAKDVTSTEGLALFNKDRYTPRIELWHRKKNQIIVDIPDNEHMMAGRALEPSIANLAAEKFGWEIERDESYTRVCGLRAGTSMDYWITSLEERTLLEIKNVGLNAFAQWNVDDDGNFEAPLRYEMQVQWEMWVLGVRKCFLAALVGGHKLVVLERTADAETQDAIINELKEFWRSVEENKEPETDWETDSQWIVDQYAEAEPDKIYDGKDDQKLKELALVYKTYVDQEKKIKENKRAIKAQIYQTIGDAEKAIGDGFSVSAGIIGPTNVPEHTKKPYRNFKLNWKRGKK